ITNPCFYGVDTSTYDELIGAKYTLEDIRKLIEADSLYFLSEEALYKASNRKQMCVACFNGKYPTALYSSLEDANKDNKF
ncbi:MAG: amidophosphoribosyltransferase, partial [Anaeroplasmataceae bacterium]